MEDWGGTNRHNQGNPQADAEARGISFSCNKYSSFPKLKNSLMPRKIDVFLVDRSILLGYVDEDTDIFDGDFNRQEYGIASKRKRPNGLPISMHVSMKLKEMDLSLLFLSLGH
jgi:hypothetical protein